MSLLLVTCSECATTLKAGAAQAGRKVRCPRCGSSLVVPSEKPSAHEEDPPEEEAPRRRKSRRRRATTSIPPWALGAGLGAAGLLLVVGIAVAVWALAAARDPRERILGAWESTDQPSGGTVEFHRDGKLTVRPVDGGTITAKYRFLDDNTLELEVANPLRSLQKDMVGRLRLPQSVQRQVPETLRGTAAIVKLTRSVLVTRSTSDGEKHFRRVR
jgi:DNA-directed RNA polymerase subunit RPC12/RpoP